MAAKHIVKRKTKGTLVSAGYPIRVVNLNLETVSSLSAKLRSAVADIEKLKADLRGLEGRVAEIELDRD
jgi:hypothetical protein